MTPQVIGAQNRQDTTNQEQDVNEALKTLKEYLDANTLKLTQQRLLIFKVLFSQKGMISSEELLAEITGLDSGISRSTVYRTMKHLHHAGVARCIRHDDGSTRYEPMGDHHSTMICERCGKTIPLMNPYLDCLQRESARQQGFTLFRFRTVIHGLCHACTVETRDEPGCPSCAALRKTKEKP
jgi:Fur family ferric uptake transcriptional regulator